MPCRDGPVSRCPVKGLCGVRGAAGLVGQGVGGGESEETAQGAPEGGEMPIPCQSAVLVAVAVVEEVEEGGFGGEGGEGGLCWYLCGGCGGGG